MKRNLTGITAGTPVQTGTNPWAPRQPQPEVRAPQAPQAAQDNPTAPPPRPLHDQGSAFSELLHTHSTTIDAHTLLELAENSLDQVTVILQQMRGLALQTFDEAEHSALRTTHNKEMLHHIHDINEIVSNTLFKGRRILFDSQGCTYFHIEPRLDKRVCINLDGGAKASNLGRIATLATADLSHLFGTAESRGMYSTRRIVDLNFFTAARHAILQINGIRVTLNRDWSGYGAEAATVMENQLNNGAQDTRYQVNYHDHRFIITADNGVTPTPTALSARGSEFTNGLVFPAKVTAPLTLTQGDFTIQVGMADPVEIVGSYRTLNELATAITLHAPHASAYANHHSGTIEISATQPLAVAGARATSREGLGITPAQALPGGNLLTISLLDQAATRKALLRIDAALDSIALQRTGYEGMRERVAGALRNVDATRDRHGIRLTDPAVAAEALSLLLGAMPAQGEAVLKAQANITPDKVKTLLNQEFSAAGLTFCHLNCERGEEQCR